MQVRTGAPPNALAAEPASVEIVQGAPGAKFLVTCDHATNRLPPEYGSLGLDEAQLRRHIGYDIGAYPIALEVGRRLNATVISSRFSRLLIDPNRGEDDPTLIMQLSDGVIIPGNVGVDEAERAKRISAFFTPYHAAIAAEIQSMLKRGVTPILVSIHTFTDIWRGVPRKWHAGILWDKDPRLALPLIRELRARTGLEIGDNEPYSGDLRNDAMYTHATLRGLANVLIEIRQDLVRDADGQKAWGTLLSECLSAIMDDPEASAAMSRVDYFGSKTDIQINGR